MKNIYNANYFKTKNQTQMQEAAFDIDISIRSSIITDSTSILFVREF